MMGLLENGRERDIKVQVEEEGAGMCESVVECRAVRQALNAATVIVFRVSNRGDCRARACYGPAGRVG